MYYKNLSLNNIIEEINGILYVEEWRDILDFEGLYQVSTFGRIKALKRIDNRNHPRNEMIRKQNYRGEYLSVTLCKKGKEFNKSVHRITAIAFHLNPENKPEVNHEDTIKTNNFYLNLKWSTPQENTDHAIANNLVSSIGENNPNSKLTKKQVLIIYNSSLKQIELAKLYNVTQHCISSIKTGKLWSHLTGKQYIKYTSYARRSKM